MFCRRLFCRRQKHEDPWTAEEDSPIIETYFVCPPTPVVALAKRGGK